MSDELEQLLEKHITELQESAYTKVLRTNSDRIQGRLVLLGYLLCGGADTQMIARAAQAIEMLHAAVTCLEAGDDEADARQTMHQAEIILANLNTDADNKIKVLSITNRTYMLVARAKSMPEDPQVTYWRATECALNPLHVGMVLAGADCHATDAVTPLTLAFGANVLKAYEFDIESLKSDLTQLLKPA